MKKWFEFISKSHIATQEYKKYQVNNQLKIVCDKVLDYVTTSGLLEKPDVADHYADTLIDEYMDVYSKIFPDSFVDRETLTKWIYDSRYSELVNRPLHQKHGDSLPEDLQEEIFSAFKSQENVFENSLSMAVHFHLPGDYFHLHHDVIKSANEQSIEEALENEYRCLIHLTDRQPGQFLQMGNDVIDWKKYDMIKWSKPRTMHGGANVGYEPRVVLRLSWLDK